MARQVNELVYLYTVSGTIGFIVLTLVIVMKMIVQEVSIHHKDKKVILSLRKEI